MIKNLGAFIWVIIISFIASDAIAQASANTEHKTGTASYYHTKFEGRPTATGEIFDNNLYTCASNHYKLGTYLKVTNIVNKKVVYVKVNDRMGHPTRVIDLTFRAAKDLNFINKGLAKVKIEVVPHSEGSKQVLAQLESKSASSPKANQL